MDEFYAALDEAQIAVVHASEDEPEAEAEPEPEITTDALQLFLKDIGKVPLLTAAQEVDLARRIEAGEFATELRELIDEEDRVDNKRLRMVTEAVVAIREHQLEKFGKIEGIGIQPDVFADRCQMHCSGRDPQFERAIALIRG